MRVSLVALGAVFALPVALAGRGSAPDIFPTECDSVPTQPPNPPNSSPTPVPRRRSPLPAKRRLSSVQLSSIHRRTGTVNYDASCDGPPPADSGYSGNDAFPTMQSVLQQAYTDAVTLANAALNVDVGNKGFTHYFGGPGTDTQLTHFNNLMGAVASPNNNYAINFVCKDVANDCSASSIMVTDSTAGGPSDVKNIVVCDQFWSGASTAYLLGDASHTTPSPPFRDNSATGWCGKKRQFGDTNVSLQPNQFFATAGNTVLHELTHLDALGAAAGLSADAKGRHGTLDAQGGCELAGARGFLRNYKAGKTDDTSPDYNAESYAAAATEIFFMQRCGFSQVNPFTKS